MLCGRRVGKRLNDAGIAAPAALDRSRSADSVWRDPGLVLSQTCGFPFSTRLRGIVRLVATPVYDVAGCEGPSYSSMIVARQAEPADDCRCVRRPPLRLQQRRLPLRLSGAARSDEGGGGRSAPRWNGSRPGSHRASIRAVAVEGADIAAIDAVCWALALRHEPEAVSRVEGDRRDAARPACRSSRRWSAPTRGRDDPRRAPRYDRRPGD